jgi:hypothetical protein
VCWHALFSRESREENVAEETKSEKEGYGQSHTPRAPEEKQQVRCNAVHRHRPALLCAHLDAEAALAPGSVRHDFSCASKENNSTTLLISLSLSAFRKLALLSRRGGRFRKRWRTKGKTRKKIKEDDER